MKARIIVDTAPITELITVTVMDMMTYVLTMMVMAVIILHIHIIQVPVYPLCRSYLSYKARKLVLEDTLPFFCADQTTYVNSHKKVKKNNNLK